MFCGNCGKEIPDGAVICPACGEAVEMAAEAETVETSAGESSGVGDEKKKRPKKKMPKRLKFIIAAALLLALIVVAFAVFPNFLSQKKYGLLTEKSWLALSLTEDRTYLAQADHLDAAIILDGGLAAVNANMDRTVAGVVTGEERSLYVAADGKDTFIEEDVNAVYLSADGTGIAFTTGKTDYTYTEAFDLYIRKGAKNERLTRECVGAAVFSPSGRQLLYVESDGKNYTLMSYSGSKAKEIITARRRIRALGVSDNGRDLYYTIEEEATGTAQAAEATLYYYDGKSYTELAQIVNENAVHFNRDFSQIVYGDTKERVWFCEHGGDSVRMKLDASAAPVTPNGEAHIYQYNAIPIYQYDCKDLRNTVWYDGTGNNYAVYLFTGEELKRIVSGVEQMIMTDNEKTLVYTKNGREGLYRIRADKEDASEETLSEDSVEAFCASSDGKKVYYITPEADVYYVKGRGKPVLVSGEQKASASLDSNTGQITYRARYSMRTKTPQLFYISENKLYSSEKGAQAVLVEDVEGDVFSIRSLGGRGDQIIVETSLNDARCIYITADGKTFTLVTSEGLLID